MLGRRVPCRARIAGRVEEGGFEVRSTSRSTDSGACRRRHPPSCRLAGGGLQEVPRGLPADCPRQLGHDAFGHDQAARRGQVLRACAPGGPGGRPSGLWRGRPLPRPGGAGCAAVPIRRARLRRGVRPRRPWSRRGWRPGAGAWRAQAAIRVAWTGLLLCGIADEPPPDPSATSPISVRDSTRTSAAILPSAPQQNASAPARSAIGVRSVCQGSSGTASPVSPGEPLHERDRERGQRAPGRAELGGQGHRGQPLVGVEDQRPPARRLQAEGGRDGVLGQGAAGHRGVPELPGPAPPAFRRSRRGRPGSAAGSGRRPA